MYGPTSGLEILLNFICAVLLSPFHPTFHRFPVSPFLALSILVSLRSTFVLASCTFPLVAFVSPFHPRPPATGHRRFRPVLLLLGLFSFLFSTLLARFYAVRGKTERSHRKNPPGRRSDGPTSRSPVYRLRISSFLVPTTEAARFSRDFRDDRRGCSMGWNLIPSDCESSFLSFVPLSWEYRREVLYERVYSWKRLTCKKGRIDGSMESY